MNEMRKLLNLMESEGQVNEEYYGAGHDVQYFIKRIEEQQLALLDIIEEHKEELQALSRQMPRDSFLSSVNGMDARQIERYASDIIGEIGDLSDEEQETWEWIADNSKDVQDYLDLMHAKKAMVSLQKVVNALTSIKETLNS